MSPELTATTIEFDGIFYTYDTSDMIWRVAGKAIYPKDLPIEVQNFCKQLLDVRK